MVLETVGVTREHKTIDEVVPDESEDPAGGSHHDVRAVRLDHLLVLRDRQAAEENSHLRIELLPQPGWSSVFTFTAGRNLLKRSYSLLIWKASSLDRRKRVKGQLSLGVVYLV